MSNTPKTVIIGAGGFLGRLLYKAHHNNYPGSIGTFYSSGKPVLDLFKPNISTLKFYESGHREVIIAAAVIDVYKCEYDKESTYVPNVIGTLELIRQIVEEGLKPIFISTDWVFRGDIGNYVDESKPDPICGYGIQKAEVESQIPIICKDNYLILRLSRMYSLIKGDNSTPDQIANSFSKGEKIKAARDQIFSPLLIDDAVRAIIGLQKLGSKGIVNINSPEVYSRLQMAFEIADEMGIDRSLVESISLDELDGINRPKRTNMICNRFNDLVSLKFTLMSKSIKGIANNYQKL